MPYDLVTRRAIDAAVASRTSCPRLSSARANGSCGRMWAGKASDVNRILSGLPVTARDPEPAVPGSGTAGGRCATDAGLPSAEFMRHQRRTRTVLPCVARRQDLAAIERGTCERSYRLRRTGAYQRTAVLPERFGSLASSAIADGSGELCRRADALNLIHRGQDQRFHRAPFGANGLLILIGNEPFIECPHDDWNNGVIKDFYEAIAEHVID
ncbi:hypothetical protein AB0L88_43145 [Saccharopolyspora shandongensis]|uniref:hypothetical protein n=1 Tax=Saccharopolyspora shandongensis TaxID=418495 RepID=UPI003427888E